jgi:type IV pilus assembly protein PilM
MSNIPELFGVDLGNSAIKACQVKKDGNSFEIINIGSEKIQTSIFDSQNDEAIKVLASKIQDLVKSANIKTRNAIVSLPESAIFSRMVTLPEMKPEELNEAIHWAVKPIVPIAIESLNISFLKIDEVIKDDKKQVNWYVVAAPKDIIEKIKNIFDTSGYNLLAIETEALAATRSIFTNYDIKGDVLIVDIGSDNTNLILARNNAVMFSQTLGTGSDSLTKVIASDYGLDETEAEKYKMSYGLDFNSGEGKIAKSLQPIVDLIVDEITRTLSYYKDKIGGSAISEIFLSGGGGNLLKLDEYLSLKLNQPVVKGNNIAKLTISKKLNITNSELLSGYNVSLGLALKGLI